MLNEIFKNISHYNGIANGIVWGIPMLCLILGVGIFYTIRTRFFQITHIKDVYDNTVKGIVNFSNDKKSAKEKNHVLSQFQALSTALASTIGTGNIAGVTTAIIIGGPGAIFWMWICAIFGMCTHFAEIVLGIYYRKYDKDIGFSGGPMYYLENGIGRDLGFKRVGKILAVLFALFTFIATFGIGNMTQVNSIADALSTNFGVSNLVVGIVLAIISAIIIIGGISRIGKVTEKIVPFMASFYIIIALIVVLYNYKYVPLAFKSIFIGAFNTKAIAGGIFGTILKRAMTYGFKRGAFSNEAGLGSSVMAHSASNEKEPIKQGLWGIFEVFFDTIIVCTMTSLIILSSTIKAPTLNETLNNLTIDDTIVCIDESVKDENGNVKLVNNDFFTMPIKTNVNNDAPLYKEKPQDGKIYLEIKVYQNTYYVEKFDEKDSNDNSYFFGSILKIRANPKYNENHELQNDENGLPIIDSIHIEPVNGVSLVTLAVSDKLSHVAGKLLAIAITLFAFSTVLGWSYYGTKTIEYLFGKKSINIYKVLYILFIIVGATINLNLVWDISDTFNGLMALPNLIGVALLSKKVLQIMKNYYERKNGKNVEPMISYE